MDSLNKIHDILDNALEEVKIDYKVYLTLKSLVNKIIEQGESEKKAHAIDVLEWIKKEKYTLTGWENECWRDFGGNTFTSAQLHDKFLNKE